MIVLPSRPDPEWREPPADVDRASRARPVSRRRGSTCGAAALPALTRIHGFGPAPRQDSARGRIEVGAGTLRGAERRGYGDQGSSLMLMPVAVLVVLLLGAIAFDLSVVQLAHRDLLDIAASAANDAATEALDQTAFRTSGQYVLDPGRAVASLARSLQRHHVDHLVTARSITIGGAGDQVTVELERTVDYVFARSLPGARGTTVRAHATATVHQR